MSVGKLREIFGRWRYRIAFLGALMVMAPLLAVSASILVPWTLDVNPGAEPTDMALVGVIAGLMALNVSVLIHNMDMRMAVNGEGIVGSAVAFFASACPVCQPIWLVWLGLGSATAFLAEYGRYISLASIALLGISLHYSLKSASGTCEVSIDGKDA